MAKEFSALRQGGFINNTLTEDELNKIMQEIDASSDGQIGNRELAAGTIVQKDLTHEVIKIAFSKLEDIKQEGFVTALSIAKWLRSRAKKISHQEIEDMLDNHG